MLTIPDLSPSRRNSRLLIQILFTTIIILLIFFFLNFNTLLRNPTELGIWFFGILVFLIVTIIVSYVIHRPREIVIDKHLVINNLEDKVILVISDVHLGQKSVPGQVTPQPMQIQCNKAAFDEFLKSILSGKIPCDYLIICGDFLELWRRDSMGVILENIDSLELLRKIRDDKIKKGIKEPVLLIVGNHDYYLRRLDKGQYDLDFYKGVKLTDINIEYWFLHGDEFDKLQDPIASDVLCLTNDPTGRLVDQIHEGLTTLLPSIFVRKSKILKPVGTRITINKLNSLSGDLKIDKEIKKFLRSKKTIPCSMLVFGHTHRAFVTNQTFNGKTICIGNAGSWIINDPTRIQSCTYLKIEKGRINIFSFS